MYNTHVDYSPMEIHVGEQPKYRRENSKTRNSVKNDSFIIEDFIQTGLHGEELSELNR